jgi:hypothetical protein
MISEDKLIEFLIQKDNFAFLMEIEGLIPKVKNYYFKKMFNKFIEMSVTPKLWPDYKIIPMEPNLTIVNNLYKENIFFNLTIYLGISDQNNWYGITGNINLFDSDIKEIRALRNILNSIGMTKVYSNWIGWKYFNRNRWDLVGITDVDSELIDFFGDWSESFWDFADKIKESLEVANKAISKEKIRGNI